MVLVWLCPAPEYQAARLQCQFNLETPLNSSLQFMDLPISTAVHSISINVCIKFSSALANLGSNVGRSEVLSGSLSTVLCFDATQVPRLKAIFQLLFLGSSREYGSGTRPFGATILR